MERGLSAAEQDLKVAKQVLSATARGLKVEELRLNSAAWELKTVEQGSDTMGKLVVAKGQQYYQSEKVSIT